MSKYLLRTTEEYRVDSEAEAANLIKEAKEDSHYTLAKYSNQYKERKAKGEVVDAWHKVTLVKDFNSEKEPIDDVEISYTSGAF